MPDKVAFAVRQCLEEAVANLIDHTPPVADETIAVELDWQNGMLVATVEDCRSGVRPARRGADGTRDKPGEHGAGRLGHPPDPSFRQ